MNNKSNTPIIIIVVMMFILSCYQGLGAYSGGSGTPEDPYQIAAAQDLMDLGNEPNDYNKSFILTADINLSDLIFNRAVIAPDMNDDKTGFQGTSFCGHLNGRGYAISHLNI